MRQNHILCVSGHVKRLLQGIGELTDLVRSFPTCVSTTLEQSAQMVDQPLTTTAEEHILPPPDSWTDLTTDHVDFSRVRGEKNVEVNRVVESGRRQESTHAPENQHASLGEWEENIPPLPHKRNSPRRGGLYVVDIEVHFCVDGFQAQMCMMLVLGSHSVWRT